MYDVVESIYNSEEGNLSLTASDILTTTYEEEYVETFFCSLNCEEESAARFYAAVL